MGSRRFDVGRKELILSLREQGQSWAQIGKTVGCSGRTAQRAVCEETRRRDLESNKASRKKNGYKYRKTPKGRVVTALAIIKVAARKRGHQPCTTPADEIVPTITEHCDLCGKAEGENGQKLCLDHDHKTGEFRGWLCTRCNIFLGTYQKLKDKAEAYLDDRFRID